MHLEAGPAKWMWPLSNVGANEDLNEGSSSEYDEKKTDQYVIKGWDPV